MGDRLSITVVVGWFVEERLISDPGSVSFAWSLRSQEEAEAKLIEQVRLFGPERTYTAFVWVEA